MPSTRFSKIQLKVISHNFKNICARNLKTSLIIINNRNLEIDCFLAIDL